MIQTPDGKDYLPNLPHMNQGTMFPILESYCECGTRIGCRQREIEKLIGDFYNMEDSSLSHIDRLANARNKMIKSIGFTRDCCILKITMYPFCIVNDVEGDDAYINTTMKESIQIKENIFLPGNSNSVPFEFIPKTRNEIGFDTNLYCQMINEVVFGPNSLDFKSNKGENSYPLFANLAITEAKCYPTIKPKTTPPFYNGDEYVM